MTPSIQELPMVIEELPRESTLALEDGRTRCTWVAGHARHYEFHDAEWGMIPDTDDLCRERLFLTCLQRDMPLVEVLDHRLELWEAFGGYDLAKMGAWNDAALDGLVARGGVFADRARLVWLGEVAAAAAATAPLYKPAEFREYVLDVRFLPAEQQIEDMTARFPGFTKYDAANLMENLGLVEGAPHERDCWRS